MEPLVHSSYQRMHHHHYKVHTEARLAVPTDVVAVWLHVKTGDRNNNRLCPSTAGPLEAVVEALHRAEVRMDNKARTNLRTVITTRGVTSVAAAQTLYHVVAEASRPTAVASLP